MSRCSSVPSAIPRTAEANCNMTINEWLNLLFRWTHVFAAILWVGSTFYFARLDAQMRRLEEKGDAARGVWMVHSGGFYSVVKQKTLGVAPSEILWFRWE